MAYWNWCFLLLDGLNFDYFKLNSDVMLALIGGTTVNVLGVFTIVANFLFPKNGHGIMPAQYPVMGRSTPKSDESQSPR